MIRGYYHRTWCKIKPVSSTGRMVPPPPPQLDQRTHRALGSASRVRLLEALRAEGPLEAEKLAERVGLHLNTVRAHLNVLREAGLVGVRSLPSAGPGRPRLAFAATDLLADEGHPGAFRLLAGILTASLQERHDGPERATSAGRAAGQSARQGPAPAAARGQRSTGQSARAPRPPWVRSATGGRGMAGWGPGHRAAPLPLQ